MNLRELWDFSDPAGSELRFREYLPHSGNQELEVLCQIARTYGLRRRFSEAHEQLDAIEQRALAADARTVTSFLLERGRTFNSSGEKEKARECFDRAVAASEGIEGLHIDALHMVGIVAGGEESLAVNLKAIELARASDKAGDRAWLGSLLNNTGWSLHDLGRFDEALALFEEAVQVRAATSSAEQIKIAHWCVARCLRSLGRHAEALARLETLDPDSGYVSEELGENLLALGRAAEAGPHFAKAYELLSQDEWLKANEAPRLERLRGLAG